MLGRNPVGPQETIHCWNWPTTSRKIQFFRELGYFNKFPATCIFIMIVKIKLGPGASGGGGGRRLVVWVVAGCVRRALGWGERTCSPARRRVCFWVSRGVICCATRLVARHSGIADICFVDWFTGVRTKTTLFLFEFRWASCVFALTMATCTGIRKERVYSGSV